MTLLTALVLIFFLGLPGPARADIFIGSLPFDCSTDGETYIVTADLNQASGTALSVTADGVTLLGADGGKTLTYASSGAGTAIEVQAGVSGLTIFDLDLVQGTVQDGSAGISGGPVSSTVIRDCTVTVRSGAGAVATAIDIAVSPSETASSIHGCTINLSGENRFYGLASEGSWNVHDNTFNVSDHAMTDCGGGDYPFVISPGTGMIIQNNTFNIDGGKVNGIASWGADNVRVIGNTIHFASTCGGRTFLMNGGADGWEIAGNAVTVTSDTSEAQYVVRIRGIDGNSADNHIVHDNTIDATGAAGEVAVVSLGDNSDMRGNRFHDNILRGTTSVISFYGLSSDTDFYCNVIEHAGADGYAVDIRDRTPADAVFSHNEITTARTDGMLVFTSVSNEANVTFCASGVDEAVVAGGGSVAVTAEPCQDGPCTDDSCTDLGYQCCEACAAEPHPELDDTCFGRVCCLSCAVEDSETADMPDLPDLPDFPDAGDEADPVDADTDPAYDLAADGRDAAADPEDEREDGRGDSGCGCALVR
jgi:hypothetical protein